MMRKVIRALAVPTLCFLLFGFANNSGAQFTGDSSFSLVKPQVADILSELNKQLNIMEVMRQTKNRISYNSGEINFILKYSRAGNHVALVDLMKKSSNSACQTYFVLYKFQDESGKKEYWGFSNVTDIPFRSKKDTRAETRKYPLAAIDAGLDLNSAEFRYLVGIVAKAIDHDMEMHCMYDW